MALKKLFHSASNGVAGMLTTLGGSYEGRARSPNSRGRAALCTTWRSQNSRSRAALVYRVKRAVQSRGRAELLHSVSNGVAGILTTLVRGRCSA